MALRLNSHPASSGDEYDTLVGDRGLTFKPLLDDRLLDHIYHSRIGKLRRDLDAVRYGCTDSVEHARRTRPAVDPNRIAIDVLRELRVEFLQDVVVRGRRG
jgi:hypothetical protein